MVLAYGRVLQVWTGALPEYSRELLICILKYGVICLAGQLKFELSIRWFIKTEPGERA